EPFPQKIISKELPTDPALNLSISWSEMRGSGDLDNSLSVSTFSIISSVLNAIGNTLKIQPHIQATVCSGWPNSTF
ncbi:hypothetical protein NP303_24895, partial [Salmonella enterica]|nr:hypothetical protein [Salmonella enterica]